MHTSDGTNEKRRACLLDHGRPQTKAVLIQTKSLKHQEFTCCYVCAWHRRPLGRQSTTTSARLMTRATQRLSCPTEVLTPLPTRCWASLHCPGNSSAMWNAQTLCQDVKPKRNRMSRGNRSLLIARFIIGALTADASAFSRRGQSSGSIAGKAIARAPADETHAELHVTISAGPLDRLAIGHDITKSDDTTARRMALMTAC
mmetsp:Transcript_111967/g.281817  ORF Transcript_111967/g.281817 Transcript_111967/m.281817 type:complete len:201 (+) Transcript_111967:77-679(+)